MAGDRGPAAAGVAGGGGGHALTSQPLDYFQANTFFPLDNSLAFSDALVGYSPTGPRGGRGAGLIARYNVLFLLAYGLAGAGSYLLARELGLEPAAAAVARRSVRVRAVAARAKRAPP